MLPAQKQGIVPQKLPVLKEDAPAWLLGGILSKIPMDKKLILGSKDKLPIQKDG